MCIFVCVVVCVGVGVVVCGCVCGACRYIHCIETNKKQKQQIRHEIAVLFVVVPAKSMHGILPLSSTSSKVKLQC